MRNTGRSRQRSVQDRAVATRGKITDGAIEVLARSGVAGLTHRAVVRAAGVSLAATTYHFDTKSDIITEASRILLDGYLTAFRRLVERMDAGAETNLRSLDDLVVRVVINAISRQRIRSLAWCELVLHGGRSVEGRALAHAWYEQFDAIWLAIAERIGPIPATARARAAVDLAVGLTFLLHPLALDAETAAGLLAGSVDAEVLLAEIADNLDRGASDAGATRAIAPLRGEERRDQIVEAAINTLIEEGAAGVSYRSVAQRAGMVRSGPSYYFPTIDGLLQTAQRALFERAKDRYRSGLAAPPSSELDEDRMLDLTTAIYFREALEFVRQNVGYYSAWLGAAQNRSLRPMVAAALLDQNRAWARRITLVSGRIPHRTTPLRMQAIFLGKLVRAMAAGVSLDDLSHVRVDFAAVLREGRDAPSS